MTNSEHANIRVHGETNGRARYRSLCQAKSVLKSDPSSYPAERNRHYAMIDNLPHDPTAARKR